MIGTVIHNYKLTETIGKGGMAVVYLGVHETLGTKAAVKVLHQNFAQDIKVRQRFQNEAKALHNLSHPNIVRLLNYEEDDQNLIMILEFIDGEDLKSYIDSHPQIREVDNALALFSQILSAFGYAHKKGLVHRDIKPSNIMITLEGEAKVLDFGIAKIADSMEASLTGTNALMGSRPYMSPEQIKSSKHIDHRSDIYSLGVTLYQLLTGTRVYDITTMSEFDVIMKIVNEPLPRLSIKLPGISNGLQAVLDKATAKDPLDRFASCEEFAKALESYTSFTHTVPIGQTLGEDTILETTAGASSNTSKSTIAEETLLEESGNSTEETLIEDHSTKKNPVEKPRAVATQKKKSPVGILLGLVGV